MKPVSDMKIGIVGAGLAGFVLSLALHKAGFRVELFERVGKIEGNGHSSLLFAPATEYLNSLGFGQYLQQHANPIKGFTFHDTDGKELTTLRNEELQYGIHRGSLELALYSKFLEEIGEKHLHLNHNFVSFEEKEDSVLLHFQSREGKKYSPIQVDLLFAADGIRSQVRKQIFPDEVAKFSGYVAHRGLVETKEEKDETWEYGHGYGDGNTGLAVVKVKSPQNSPLTALIFIVKEQTTKEESWTLPSDKDHIFHHFSHYTAPKDLTLLLEKATNFSAYYLYHKDPISKWHFGRVVLLGDAAHPMLPFAGQGAGQAILDCQCLAETLQANLRQVETSVGDGVTKVTMLDHVAAFQAYQDRRLPPTRAAFEFAANMGIWSLFGHYKKTGKVLEITHEANPLKKGIHSKF